MRQWGSVEGYSEIEVDDGVMRVVATAWYGTHAWCWRVTCDGFPVREGRSEPDRVSAQRQAEVLIDGLFDGTVDYPGRQAAARKDLERRILEARAKDPNKKQVPWGWVP